MMKILEEHLAIITLNWSWHFPDLENASTKTLYDFALCNILVIEYCLTHLWGDLTVSPMIAHICIGEFSN